MKKIFVLLSLMYYSLNSTAQFKTDAGYIFKIQLFLNMNNIIFKEKDTSIQKNDSLFNNFNNLVLLNMDTLKISGDFDLTKSVFAPKFEFYKINLGSAEKSSLRYKRELSGKEDYFLIGGGTFEILVLAINIETGKSYRLSGFDINDILSFVTDFKEMYNKENSEKLSTSKFLKNYHVESLDFECLYRGIKSDVIDRKKFPCLQRVNDPITIH